MRRQPYVAVVGPAAGSELELERAEEVGRLLAREGAVLVCGGLGGVMHAAARGCEAEGGLSIGVVPNDDRDPASPHLTLCIATGLGEARNAIVVRSVDAVIAVGGEFGTLSEIALALKMNKPVIGIDTWELSKGGTPRNAIVRASDPADAVAKALEAARARP